ncbi:MAG: hypothetical protein J7498_05925 [Sphingobium sp.]|nr:hypothetical protein [Sphingobium sp.]
MTSAPMNDGNGAYPAMFEEDSSLPAHVVYRPRNLSSLKGRKLPVYIWGNGGCSADGTSSRNHLVEIASHGYLVVAAGTIPKGPPHAAPAAPPPPAADTPSRPAGPLPAATPTASLREALDWVVRENARRGSQYQGRIATDRIAVSGWSCGGLQALNVASDPRVKTAVIMNSGFFNGGGSQISGIESDKASLARLHTPILYILGGPTDIAYENGMDDFKRISAVPTAVVNIPVGHGGTYFEANGGLAAQIAISWLDWQLKGDRAAASRFIGPNCAYCSDSRFTMERKNLKVASK